MSIFNIIEDYYQILLKLSLPLSKTCLWGRLVTMLVICFLRANSRAKAQEQLSAFLLFSSVGELS